MKKRIGNIGLRSKFLFVLLLAVVVVLSSEIIGRRLIYKEYNQQLYQKTAQVLTAFSSRVESEINQMRSLTLTVIGDSTVQKNLMRARDSTYGSGDWLIAHAKLNVQMQYYALQNKYFSRFVIQTDHTVFSFSGGNTASFLSLDLNEYAQIALKAGGEMVMVSREQGLTLVREIRQTQNLDLSTLGVIIAGINLDALFENFKTGSEQLGVALNVSMYDGDICVYSDDASAPGNVPERTGWEIQGNTFVTTYHSAQYGYTYVITTPYDAILASIRRANLHSYLLILLIAIFSVGISVLLFRSITKEFSVLIQKMDAMGAGQLPPEKEFQVYRDRRDEIGLLNRHFYRMTRDYKQLTEEHFTSMTLLKDAQFSQLQKQVQPHFLFNTLATVSSLAYKNRDDEVAHIVEKLTNMMRAAIHNDSAMITVGEDLQLALDYLYIQNIRHGDRLAIAVHVPQEMKSLPIPRMTLQPIVENAICHALEEMLEPCKLSIQGVILETKAQLTVSDNGPGMDSDILEQLRLGRATPAGNGIGLRNIQSRLQLAFSAEYGLQIQRSKGETQVSVWIPVQEVDSPEKLEE